MNWQLFNITGYLSVALWLAALVLLAAHWVRRPRRWLCHCALGVALLAYGLAKINSVTHVGRIQLDQSAELAAAQAKLLAARKAAEQSRAADVAQIRFAEDSSGDFLDKGVQSVRSEEDFMKFAGHFEAVVGFLYGMGSVQS